jgi:hypothetical protein
MENRAILGLNHQKEQKNIKGILDKCKECAIDKGRQNNVNKMSDHIV